MKTIRTLIIDDERLAREEMKSILKEFTELEIIGEANDGVEGLEKIEELSPDLIFLDINMPGLNGFEMLKKLDNIPYVIFVTAYDEYAIKAFEVNALDYLLKPIDIERLNESINKLRLKIESEYESELPLRVSRENKVLGKKDKVFIKDGEKCFFVQLSDVRMLESDGNYVKVHFGKSRPLILRSLNSFEEKLDPESFFRANRKFIVNLDWIASVENWFNGGLQLELTTGEKVEVSRRQTIRFKELFSF
jgi:two-component system, LytTR family, response regulator